MSLVGEQERKLLKEVVKKAKTPLKTRIVPQGISTHFYLLLYLLYTWEAIVLPTIFWEVYKFLNNNQPCFIVIIFKEDTCTGHYCFKKKSDQF